MRRSQLFLKFLEEKGTDMTQGRLRYAKTTFFTFGCKEIFSFTKCFSGNSFCSLQKVNRTKSLDFLSLMKGSSSGL
jgi:hypothetical protein